MNSDTRMRKPVKLPSQTGFLGRGKRDLFPERLDFAFEIFAWDKLDGP
jgi:hypothetical protein